jgi:hypothetical protein
VSSSISRRYNAVQRSTIHPLIAVSSAFLFILCLDTLVRGVFPIIRFPPAIFLPGLLLVGIEVTAMGNLFRSVRAGVNARLRELLLLMIVSYAVFDAILSIRGRKFVPASTELIYPILLVFLQWGITLLIHRSLREREMLLAVLPDQEGEEMLHVLRDSSFQARSSLDSNRRIQALLLFFQSLVFISLLTLLAVGIRIEPWRLLVCAVHAVHGMIAIGLLNTYWQDQYLLGEGIIVPGGLEARRMWAALGMIVFCIPIALLASRNAAVLPLSLITDFLSWLANLIPRDEWKIYMEGVRQTFQQRLLAQRQMSSALYTPFNPLFLFAIEAVRRLLITMAGAALYFFLVSPLLSEGFFEWLSRHSLRAFLARKLRSLLHLFIFAISWIATPREKRLRRIGWPSKAWGKAAVLSPGRRERISARKRVQVGRILRAFLLLLEWGKEGGVEYRSFEVPMEYALRLSVKFPDGITRLTPIIDVLEEALFSSHLVEKRRLAAYYSAIREIVRAG